VLPMNGGEADQITKAEERRAAVSGGGPDGKAFAFVASDEKTGERKGPAAKFEDAVRAGKHSLPSRRATAFVTHSGRLGR